MYQTFSKFFLENIEKVWYLENFHHIAKVRKMKAKTKSQHFFVLQFLDGDASNLCFGVNW